MKNFVLLFTIVVLVSLSMGQPIVLPALEIVDPNVAVFAATTYVPTFYPGKWGFYERQECYNIEGSVSAHIIIFKNMDRIADTPKELSEYLSLSFREVKDYESKLPSFSSTEDPQKVNQEKLEQIQIINQMKRERYRTKEYTTVVTGSTTYSPVVIRWIPGLPELMVKKEQIIAWLKETCGDSFTFRKLIYISPKDIRYEVVSSNGEVYLVDFSKKEFSLQLLEQAKKDIAQQPLPIPKDLPESQRQILEEGEKVRKLRNIQLWKNYRTLYQSIKVE